MTFIVFLDMHVRHSWKYGNRLKIVTDMLSLVTWHYKRFLSQCINYIKKIIIPFVQEVSKFKFCHHNFDFYEDIFINSKVW